MTVPRSVVILLAALLAVSSARGDVFTKTLAPGVTLSQDVDKKTPLLVSILTVDLTNPAVHVGVGIGQDTISGDDPSHGREDVSRYARRHGTLAAVNADFFPYTGDPLGVGIQDGKLFSEPYGTGQKGGPRVAFGVTADGRVVFDALDYLGDLQSSDGTRAVLSGLNRPGGTNEIVCQTALYGPVSSDPKGGIVVAVHAANLPVRVNKLVTGIVSQVLDNPPAPVPVPSDGFVLVAAPGKGADFLRGHLHAGERVGFVCAVALPGETSGAVRLAAVPRTANDLPSRSGDGVSRAAFVWANMVNAVGGGPRLLVNGNIAIDGGAEGFAAGFITQPNPRTAVGVSRDGKRLFLVTVDGRQSLSRGVSLTDLAALLLRYGAWNAINLDGGGSTAMSVAGLTVNNPEASGAERPVADMLTVDSDARMIAPISERGTGEVSPPDPLVSLVLPAVPLAVGVQTPLHLAVGGEMVSRTDPHLLWQGLVSNGVGFVSQNGYFMAVKPGTGVVTALWKGTLVTGLISVVGKDFVPVYAVHATFARDTQLTVRIVDQTGKPLANAPVHLVVAGGTADKTDVTTDADGSISVPIVWNETAGGSVAVNPAGMRTIIVVRPVSAVPAGGGKPL